MGDFEKNRVVLRLGNDRPRETFAEEQIALTDFNTTPLGRRHVEEAAGGSPFAPSFATVTLMPERYPKYDATSSFLQHLFDTQ